MRQRNNFGENRKSENDNENLPRPSGETESSGGSKFVYGVITPNWIS